MNMKDYLKEQSLEDHQSSKRALICAANPHNITPIYPQLMDFIGVIESALKPDPGTHCTLYAFLMDYIKDVFLGQIHADNGDALNSASLSLDSWKAITDSDILRDLGVQRPLLQSTVDIKKNIDDLNNYIKTLPLYSEHFLTMICSMVMQYKVILCKFERLSTIFTSLSNTAFSDFFRHYRYNKAKSKSSLRPRAQYSTPKTRLSRQSR